MMSLMLMGAAAANRKRGPRLWTPADYPVPMQVWADWDSVITEVSGHASAWSNSKGSIGGAFSQSSAGAQPALIDISGKRALRLDGANDFMRIESVGAGNLFRAADGAWCFTVFKKRTTDVSTQNRVVVYAPEGSSGGTRFMVGLGFTSPNANMMAARRLDNDPTSILSAPPVPGDWVIRCDVMQWGTGAGASYVNGNLEASNANLTSSGRTSNTSGRNNRISLGADATTSPGAFADIDIACIIMGAGPPPSEADRQRFEGWAAWECGLQGNLPAAHPYKISPPTAAKRMVDILVVAGQSNAEGRGESSQSPPVSPEAGVWWDGVGYASLSDPVGGANTGSAWPTYADAYFTETGRTTLVVSTAVGGSGLLPGVGSSDWSPLGANRTNAVTSANAAISHVTSDPNVTLGRVFLYWQQGESDALDSVDPGDYQPAQEDLFAYFFDHLERLDAVLVSELGDSVPQNPNFEEIRGAQNLAVSATPDCYIAFSGAKLFPSQGKMKDSLHYSQGGLNEIGAGVALFAASL